MALWVVGPENRRDFASSAYDRVVLDHLGGRPVDVDHEIGPRVVAAAADLAHAGAPVLHDVGSGGIAVAVAEICIASGIGTELDNGDWRAWLSESPHRFLAVLPAGETPDVGDLPARILGTMGGDHISFGRHGAAPLDLATRTWRDAIPRRMK
jgi:phosphoribosylformylglycinamidine synthase